MNNERWERRLRGTNPLEYKVPIQKESDSISCKDLAISMGFPGELKIYESRQERKNNIKSIVRKCVDECREEYKDKIKEDAYFERGFLFAISELYSRLSKAIENEIK